MDVKQILDEETIENLKITAKTLSKSFVFISTSQANKEPRQDKDFLSDGELYLFRSKYSYVFSNNKNGKNYFKYVIEV